jgi:2-iminobutanoate/2-iminopropanoate deaminase
VAAETGRYSDAIETAASLRWLHTSGTPGLSLAGELPGDIEGQSEIAWNHIIEMLKRADMTTSDLVKVTHYLTRAQDIPGYVKVRSRFLGDARPASMLLMVNQLVGPDMLVEVEAIAARAG